MHLDQLSFFSASSQDDTVPIHSAYLKIGEYSIFTNLIISDVFVSEKAILSETHLRLIIIRSGKSYEMNRLLCRSVILSLAQEFFYVIQL